MNSNIIFVIVIDLYDTDNTHSNFYRNIILILREKYPKSDLYFFFSCGQ